MKITANMTKTLAALTVAGEVENAGTKALNKAGCSMAAIKALMSRGLVELVTTGETRPAYHGGTYAVTAYRLTDSARALVL